MGREEQGLVGWLVGWVGGWLVGLVELVGLVGLGWVGGGWLAGWLVGWVGFVSGASSMCVYVHDR